MESYYNTVLPRVLPYTRVLSVARGRNPAHKDPSLTRTMILIPGLLLYSPVYPTLSTGNRPYSI